LHLQHARALLLRSGGHALVKSSVRVLAQALDHCARFFGKVRSCVCLGRLAFKPKGIRDIREFFAVSVLVVVNGVGQLVDENVNCSASVTDDGRHEDLRSSVRGARGAPTLPDRGALRVSLASGPSHGHANYRQFVTCAFKRRANGANYLS